MCGLTGFYQLDAKNNKSERIDVVQKMTSMLTHRGPDQAGSWAASDVPLVFGHRRLSIMDLSDAGRQPMASHTERYTAVYNGEIFNVSELMRELEGEGVKFKGHSDTEVFLAACDVWGVNITLQKMHGMFAIALWDDQQRQLHLIRDRLGKKPLYVGWADDALVFGSELKALRAHPSYQQVLDKDAADLYFKYAYVPAPYAMDKGVWQLRPGHRMIFDLSGDKPLNSGSDLSKDMVPYWDAREVAMDQRRVMRRASDDDAVINEFEELLKECVKDRMLSDVPLGAFLSGGIDSSAIVALMQAQQQQPVKTYTIGFEQDGFDESIYARDIAQHLGTDHHEVYLSKQDALDIIVDLPQIYDEPFADISAIPTALVSKFAARDVTVALSGDGGDEMLGGYNRHTQIPQLWRRVQPAPVFARKMVGGLLSAVPTIFWDAALSSVRPQAGTAVHKAASLLGGRNPHAMYDNVVSHWKERSPMLGRQVAAPAGGKSFDVMIGAAESMMLQDTVSYLPSGVLVKVDRASMASGLEVRSPLLDKRIFEYVWKLPLEYKIRGGSGKWLLRQLLKKYVPEQLFERPKQGFSMPVGHWLRDDLRDWAEDLLDAEQIKRQGILDAKIVRNVWNKHLKGQGQYETQLWSVLMFQAWARKWM